MNECDGFHRSCDNVGVRDYTIGKPGKGGRRAASLCFACAKTAMAHGFDLKAVAIMMVDEPQQAVQR